MQKGKEPFFAKVGAGVGVTAFSGNRTAGGMQITVSNVGKVRAFGEKGLEIAAGNHTVSFRGERISIAVLDKKILEISGDIREIYLENANNY